jgi:hypothetical protein
MDMGNDTITPNPVEMKRAIIETLHLDETQAKGVYVVGTDSDGSAPSLRLEKPEYHDTDIAELNGLGWRLVMLWSKSNTSKLTGLFAYTGAKVAPA